MLILTRRIGETIMVGEDVSITVIGFNGGQVRVGVNARREVPIYREEIYREIKQAQSERGLAAVDCV